MSKIINNIDLKKVYESGQVFNWYDVGDSYIVPINDSLFKLTQLPDLAIEVDLVSGEFFDLKDYFDESVNYLDELDRISKKYPELAEAARISEGLILLKQDYLEILITFIFSANNNIPRIKNSIEMLRTELGDYICDYDGKAYYSFPSVQKMLTYTEDDFKRIGAGYRAKYLAKTVIMIAETEDFQDWQNLKNKDLIARLKTLHGVGPKVAHCIALYGYHRREVFPVDTWIKKALKKYYNLENLSEKQIEEKLLKKFGKDSALVQQIMFYAERG